ncbi:hypothetical protein [Amylibacter sp. IMCC11727]|uniref:hypothetical protein n=1 Tax=Amylibacter sp. IMCC11727 TaxID=3039851 RepID=UPI00244E04B4|nr:hypothetical protein [Amylibacter sp. IMCC11727]WGI20716.1 hypothetical protein QBD29_11395 [Amylibacter sp. IMCC11727]
MSVINKISVNACDNELIIIASTDRGSSELMHLKSGFNAPVSYSVNPAHILAPGKYDLTVIGINWGGPGKISVDIDGDSPQTLSGSGGKGVFFSETIPMVVA